MGKVDRTVAIVGIVLLVITAGALLYVQEFANLEDITYESSHVMLESQGPAEVMPGGLAFNWSEPMTNSVGTAYAANASVVIDFNGQAGAGGDAQYKIVMKGPDGVLSKTVIDKFTISPGATSGQITQVIDLSWAAVPEPERGNPASIDRDLNWDQPLVVEVTVESPPDVLGPLTSYTFTATVSAELHVYQETVA